MTNNQLTDERVTSVIERLEHYACSLKWTNVRGAQDLLAAADGLRELQERRKAAMDSEPVADVVAWSHPNEERKCDIRWRRHDVEPGPLYRHAQPASVVPEEKQIPNTLSMYAVDAVAAIAEVKGWNACRAAMLAAAPQEVKGE